MKLFRKTKDDDAQFKVLMDTKGYLQDIQGKVAKEINSTHAAIDNRRKLAKSILSYGDHVMQQKNEETALLGECLGKVAVLETVVGDFATRLNQALEAKVERPIDEFVKSEISAAEKEKKLADKAKSSFDAADAKMNNLKGRGDAKSFEAEKERNMLQERFLQAKKQADTTISDAIEKNKFNVMEHLCDYIELYYEFFKSGTTAIEQLLTNIEQYKQTALKQRNEYKARTTGAPASQGENESETADEEDIMLQGWLMRQTKHNWKKEWAVVKFKYLYCYNNPEEKSLREVIPLVRCSVDKATRKKNCFAINGKIDSHFFRVQTESERERWMAAIASSIEEMEAHETRELGKVEIKGSTEISDDESDEELDEEGLDPRRKLLYRLLKDERTYIKRLGRATKLYYVPLHSDPRLKPHISLLELDVIFGHGKLKAIELLHAGILEQLENAEMSSLSAIFLEKIEDFERLYIPYLCKLGNAMFQLNIVTDRSRAIKKFLKELEERLSEGNELATLLALPIQRFADYIKFFEDMMKLVVETPVERRRGRKDSFIGDDPVLKDVIEVLGNLQKQINEGSAFSSNLHKLMNIRRQLENYEGNLVDPKRVFLREGPLQMQKPPLPPNPQASNVPKIGSEKSKMTSCYAFLFNDMIIFTKPVFGTKKYTALSTVDLHKTRIVDPSEYANKSSKKDIELVFKIEEKQMGKHAKGNIIKLKAPALQDKVSWLCDIDSALIDIEKTKKVYGVSLELLMNNREKGRDVPAIMEKAINWLVKNGLAKQGIFRLSGNLQNIEAYKDKVNQGQEVDFPVTEDAYVVAGLLSHFFMDLPEPLLTRALNPAFVSALDREDRLGALKDAVHQLPMHNMFMLQYLMSFFQLVVSNEQENKMGPPNLAIVYGPTLLGSSTGPTMLNDFANNQQIVSLFITNYDEIFSDAECQRKEFNLRRLAEKEEQEAELDKKRNRISQRVSEMRASAIIPQSEIPVPKRPAPANAQGGIRKSLPVPPPNSAPDGDGAKKLPPAPPPKLRGSDGQGIPTSPQPKKLPPVPGLGPKRPPSGSPFSSSENVLAAVATAKPAPPPIKTGQKQKEGWLTKKGGNRRNWQTRWFVLKSPELSYYKNKKDAKPKGVILLGGAKVKESNHKQYCFGVSLHERTYLMVAKDEKEKGEWMQAIDECIKSI